MRCRLDFFIGSICFGNYPCVGSSGKNGHPSEFGFKDILPLFKAERWNPDSLVALYVSSSSGYKGRVRAAFFHHICKKAAGAVIISSFSTSIE